jgi:alkylation response protein AidB-like acyl-CoA dehydrogenase
VDFRFDEVQEDVRGLTSQLLEATVTPTRLRELEAGLDRMDRALWQDLATANLLGLCLPERDGGSGYGVMEAAVVLEELGRHVAPVPFLETVVLGAMTVAELGTEAQRGRLLPPVVDGTSVLTAALQEPAAADPLDPATVARRDGTSWRLEGEKVAVAWGPSADAVLVPATTGPGRVGLFLVEPDAAGLVAERTESTHRQPQLNLTLDGVAVAGGAVLGDPEAGQEDALRLHRRALAGLCALAVGVFQEAVRITAGYIAEREQFGRPIATFQGATLKAADAYIETQGVTLAARSATWRLAAGRPADDELAIAKFWVADAGHRIAHACQHLHGGMGVDVDYPIHRYFLWAKELELTLGGATPQLLRLGASLAEEATCSST